eukprot:735118-Rhodomonas_salina.2
MSAGETERGLHASMMVSGVVLSIVLGLWCVSSVRNKAGEWRANTDDDEIQDVPTCATQHWLRAIAKSDREQLTYLGTSKEDPERERDAFQPSEMKGMNQCA